MLGREINADVSLLALFIGNLTRSVSPFDSYALRMSIKEAILLFSLKKLKKLGSKT